MSPFPDFLVFPCVVVVDSNERAGGRDYLFASPPGEAPILAEPLDPLVDGPGLVVPYRGPFGFAGLPADADRKGRPLLINTRVANLVWGDYSLSGLEHRVAVERKTKSDFGASCTVRRGNFEREIASLNAFDAAAVVVEATWEEVLTDPPGRVCGRSLYRTVLAWCQRYPRVHWFMLGSRRLAEVTCFRFLERYWRDRVGGPRV